jgi:hypothetical protein
VRLYHFDLRRNIEAILREGFHDGDVWLSDISLYDADPPLGAAFAQVVVDAPTDRLAEFEVVGNPTAGEGYREFRIPAALLNTWLQMTAR